ncbi:MAG TPA: type IV pilus secretin PilQ [Pyrinomonadaceae bacterium]|nr:type IV pilus secretin PilQ [Pyrinomonadaceae bacterium]
MDFKLQTFYAFARRGALGLLLVCALGANALAGGATALSSPPVAKAVRAVTDGAATRIIIAGTAPMAYTVRRPAPDSLVVELPGVDASRLAPNYHFSSPLVSKVTVARAHSNGAATASLQIALRAPVRDRSQLNDNDLVLELWPVSTDVGGAKMKAHVETVAPSAAASETVKAPATDVTAQTANPGITPASPNNTQQSDQGRRYGEPGFIGEPVNLNVVNADIRDILNYITEQYGVNFVIDNSVGRVPVTINVTEVPWNIALDAILKANRLGIETNGNILRVATQEVLATEAAVQAQIRDARLNNSPLITEFVRLNYARAGATLSQAAGTTGGFSGGSTGGASGDGAGGGGGILPIISRRLSKRGGIEYDERSNTLIITDVRENIDSIRQLITLLDQPEPQVEIETRIVIASRNFSRDLGVQLSAGVLGTGRGALGNFTTLPSTSGSGGGGGGNTVATGPNPAGVFGGLDGTTQPTPTLAATAANTVIGLTTGVFGTAQISALITAAETKGQAKTVATPRVTALNNRAAQIESGSQIPVVTPQTGGAGGGNVFTTTFVSVPLRLSITPQISDAGSVVLRVTMENNTVNGTLTNSLGTPGIDTQRMQTEVLVPDGGTTVVGGVLNDREAETQNRTPGLSGIPVIGNLFKRRATARTTDEILFFITPRIYRPDYQGRRVEGGAATDRTRFTSIPQPVPLGNPQSNTPASAPQTEQQQQPTTPLIVVPNPSVNTPPSTPQPQPGSGARP